MTALRILLALAAAAIGQVLVVEVLPRGGHLFDPFLLVVVWYGLRVGPLGSQIVGTVAGLVHDGLTGGLYGLYAFADTLVGYLTSLSSGRVVLQQGPARVVLFAAAALAQQLIVAVLLLALAPELELPGPGWVLGRMAVNALAGAVLMAGERRLRVQWANWQRARARKLRF